MGRAVMCHGPNGNEHGLTEEASHSAIEAAAAAMQAVDERGEAWTYRRLAAVALAAARAVPATPTENEKDAADEDACMEQFAGTFGGTTSDQFFCMRREGHQGPHDWPEGRKL